MSVPTSSQMANQLPLQISTIPPAAVTTLSATLAASALSSTAAGAMLPQGLQCRYHSERHGWLLCKILRSNPSWGTYDLDVRQQAAAHKLAPPLADTGLNHFSIWPVGSFVSYISQSKGTLATEIKSFNHSDGTYNLGVREHAHPDRIRARIASGVVLPQASSASTAATSIPAPTAASFAATNPFATISANAQQQQGYYFAPSTSLLQPPLSAPALATLPPAAAPQLTCDAFMFSQLQPSPVVSALGPYGAMGVVAHEDSSPMIRPIVHPGHAPREDEELVGVIVTICSGASYDALFSQVPQLAGEGKRVATYSASPGSLSHILGELSGHPRTCRRPSDLHRNLRHLVADIQAVQADSVVFNWECCSGCSSDHLECSSTVIKLVKHLLDQGHMVMFSDFSLKALIQHWKEDLLGPNPFVKVSEFGGKFQLRFDPTTLSESPSAQLQKLGELANEGKAELNALPSTIAFSVKWSKADCSAYQCKALTVMTEFGGTSARPARGEGCEAGGHRGLAGHVLLTYPSGGKLLVSAGHWIELSRLDVSEETFLKAAAGFGEAFSNEVVTSMAACSTAAERNQTVQAYSSQMIQQCSPCSYSMPPQPRSAPAQMNNA